MTSFMLTLALICQYGSPQVEAQASPQDQREYVLVPAPQTAPAPLVAEQITIPVNASGWQFNCNKAGPPQTQAQARTRWGLCAWMPEFRLGGIQLVRQQTVAVPVVPEQRREIVYVQQAPAPQVRLTAPPTAPSKQLRSPGKVPAGDELVDGLADLVAEIRADRRANDRRFRRIEEALDGRVDLDDDDAPLPPPSEPIERELPKLPPPRISAEGDDQ